MHLLIAPDCQLSRGWQLVPFITSLQPGLTCLQPDFTKCVFPVRQLEQNHACLLTRHHRTSPGPNSFSPASPAWNAASPKAPARLVLSLKLSTLTHRTFKVFADRAFKSQLEAVSRTSPTRVVTVCMYWIDTCHRLNSLARSYLSASNRHACAQLTTILPRPA